MCSWSMLVITAIAGESFRNDRSLSSASATMYSPAPEARVAAECAQPPADHRGGIQSAAFEHQRHHRRGRGLAVSAGDGDAESQPHQLGEHLGPGNDRHLPVVSRRDFRVVERDRRRHDDDVGVADVGAGMSDRDRHAERGQPIGDLRAPGVGSAHGIAQDWRAARRCHSFQCRQSRRSARAACARAQLHDAANRDDRGPRSGPRASGRAKVLTAVVIASSRPGRRPTPPLPPPTNRPSSPARSSSTAAPASASTCAFLR